MKKIILFSFLLGFSMAIPAMVSAGELARQILGVRLDMTKDQAHERLKEIGTFVRDEANRQEVWTVRDPSFSQLIIGFREDEKLRFVTAVAREDKEAKRVEYSDLGNLKEAQRAGDPTNNDFAYGWNLPATKGNPPTLVIARGHDAKFLSTYSLKNLTLESAPEKND
ncbi:MAG: hypothetical protein ABJB09_03535 [Verrucomicrobiota bacterium]